MRRGYFDIPSWNLQFAPDIMIAPRPEMKKRNIRANRVFTVLLAPLNSFHTKMPHRAAIMGAPCPSA